MSQRIPARLTFDSADKRVVLEVKGTSGIFIGGFLHE